LEIDLLKGLNVALLTIVKRDNQAQTQTQQKNTVLSGGLFLLKLVKGITQRLPSVL